MRNRWLWLSLVPTLAAGCGDDEHITPDAPVHDAAPSPDQAPVPDAPAADAGPTPVARGDYLVNHVVPCGDCHTPRLMTGMPDPARFLAGVDCFLDVDPMDPMVGCLATPNLTGDATGLEGESDAQIKAMFQDGVRADGRALFPVMPYFAFHNMTAFDADAVVAYLRTVPAVAHTPAANQPPWTDAMRPPAPVAAIDPALAPPGPPMTDPTYASAMRGRYLAVNTGSCIDCHTIENPPGPGVPIDLTRAFQGNRAFPMGPPLGTVFSSNLTQAVGGLMGWTAADVVTVLKMGQDRTGGGVCPPMPAGPMAPFGGLTDADALDLANYIVSLPAGGGAVTAECALP